MTKITNVEYMERTKPIPPNEGVRKRWWHWVGHTLRKTWLVNPCTGTHRSKETEGNLKIHEGVNSAM